MLRACVVAPEGPVTALKEKVQPMARKPNYDFERKERERLKAQKNAARAEAKLKPPAEDGPAAEHGDETTEQ
jgi:hypothetical protein